MIVYTEPELYWLVFTITMTALLWIPQIVHSIFRVGPKKAFLYPDQAAKEYADWAIRAKAAHNNAVENLIIFAPLTLIVLLLNVSTQLTALAAAIYFFSRALHFIMHIIALPLMRTVCFLVGFACQFVMVFTLFVAIL